MIPPEQSHSRHAAWLELCQLRAAPELIAEVEQITSGQELAAQTLLRRRWPDVLVRGAFALVECRRRAQEKFSRASEMWLDRKGLEQATAELVATYKSRRFGGEVLDLCCGIGGDALALASRGPVTAVDFDPVNCQRAEWNSEVYGVSANLTVDCRDVTTVPVAGRLVHLDPDRRQSGQKAVRLEDYVPGPDYLNQLMQSAAGGAIKLSPASNFVGRFPEAEIELISLRGECKEATVWFGSLAGTEPWRATILPEQVTVAGHPLEHVAEQSPPRAYLYDPDPAVVRAGLVDLVANQLGLTRLDDREEYLTSDTLVQSPLVRAFAVEAVLPNNASDIRNHFRTSRFGQVEIKCRHVPIQAEDLRRRLPLPGKEPGVLIFARIGGRARAVVSRRVDS
jgi:SAM-dependent methyltransferase